MLQDPNKNFPMIFDTVNGECQKDPHGSSSYNTQEITVVVDYVKRLLSKKWNDVQLNKNDIGVVSPYIAQVDRIRDKLRENGLEEIRVGTAETYQGQEKKVIIISTVRTNDELGFVGDDQVRNLS